VQLEKKWKKVEDPDAPETTADAVKGLTRTETIEVSGSGFPLLPVELLLEWTGS
jgi:hypothetical protein